MGTIDLWPSEIASDNELEGPTVLLREQAALLGKKTKNLVEAEVRTITDLGGDFIDIFTISSATLNYHYTLFQVNYPLEFYPANVVWEGFRHIGYNIVVGETPARQVHSRIELESALQIIFADTKTVRIIQALLSRSRGQSESASQHS